MEGGALDPKIHARILGALARSPLFKGMNPNALDQVVKYGEVARFKDGDPLVRQGDAADSFLLLLHGEASVTVTSKSGESHEVARLTENDSIGEMGLLLQSPRSATVVARGQVTALRFKLKTFVKMFQAIPNFGFGICRALAARLSEADRHMSLPESDLAESSPPKEVLDLLPREFVERHQVLPMELDGDTVCLGIVNDPTPAVVNAIRQHLPGMQIRMVRVGEAAFYETLQDFAQAPMAARASPSKSSAGSSAKPFQGSMPSLDTMLERMVAEGASDLHLSATYSPRWRVDGEMAEVPGLPTLEKEQVLELFAQAAPPELLEDFRVENDADFAYEIDGLARFRVNLFRDHRGAGAVLRLIPSTVLGFEQLGLPAILGTMCDHPKGLVLVTGPTGSGKSTTLAAMLDRINRERAVHIITLEDPIEFVHESKKALINQREVGSHTASFHRALKAALREDPDIVLVGELRDLETVRLALETANTGHLVFGTLHTNTAVGTVERVIGMFPIDEQPLIRSILADVIKGVVSQTLCRRIGGGRVAAIETLIGSHAVSNLIREGKTYQIPNIMSSARGAGNVMLNDALLALFRANKITRDEALSKSIDKSGLERSLG